MDEKEKIFTYRYSAERQKEVREIREKYERKVPEDSRMDELRKLDHRVQKAGVIPSLILGVAGTLVMGIGMCCTMVWQGVWFVPGIAIGLIGLAGMAAAYPLNNRLIKRRKEQLTPRILKLTEELMQ